MYHHTKRIAAAAILLGLVAILVRPAQGDFILWDDEEETVNTSHNEGTLYDESKAHIVAGGHVNILNAYDSSAVNASDGSVWRLSARNSSAVNMSGGEVLYRLNAYDSIAVNVSDGRVSGDLHAKNNSTVTFHARDFDSEDLSLVEGDVWGTGQLSGEWFDGTPWTVAITKNDSTIRAIPEPSALMLMGVALLGGLLLRKRFNSVKST